MNQRHLHQKRSFTRWMVIVGAMWTFGLLGSGQVAAIGEEDLTDTSPTPDMMKIVSGTRTYNDATRHFLTNADDGHVNLVRLGVYYASNTTDKTVTVTGGASTECNLINFRNTEPAIKIRAIVGGVTVRENIVRKQDACNPVPRRGETRNMTLTIPRASLPRTLDSNSQKYKVVIEIELVNKTVTNPDRRDRLLFGFRAPGAIVGNIDTNDSDTVVNNSLIPKPLGGRGKIQALYPFGLSCDVNESVSKTVTFYDAENGTGRQTDSNGNRININFLIQEYRNGQWVSLKGIDGSGEYVEGSMRRASYDPSDGSITPNNGRSVNASITIKAMKPKTRYRMVVRDLYSFGDNGFSNYIYVGLPGDSIFGSGNFTCGNTNTATYSLVPAINVSPGAVSRGGRIDVEPRITNNGQGDAGRHDWKVTRLEFAPGESINSSPLPTGSGDVCNQARYSNKTNCGITETGNDNFPGGEVAPDGTYAAGVSNTIPIGTRICFITSVQTPTESQNGQWAHSDIKCVVVGTYPKAQFWGYDVFSGGRMIGSTSRIGGQTYGSWGEYGMKATREIQDIASGSGLEDGAASPVQSSWSNLTYANTLTQTDGNCEAAFGCHASYTYPRAFVERLMAMTTCRAGNASFGSGLNTGIHCVNGTATITDDITYGSDPTVGAGGSFPQRIIIAKDIVIDPSVKRLQAWLIAVPDFDSSNLPVDGTGRLSTCSSVDFAEWQDARLTSNRCDDRLTVTGPTVANELYLFRTGGDRDEAAETFNLRADAFYAAYRGQGGSRVSAQTVSVTELPPRF